MDRLPRHLKYVLAACALAGVFAGCSGSGQAPSTSSDAPAPAASTSTAVSSATSAGTSRAAPAPTGVAVARPSTPLSQQQLDQLALSAPDLPVGFAITGSGPGGPELGPDVIASYQEEFQQRDVTSTQALQQTIVIIDLIGQYKDVNSTLSGIKAISVASLNQLLGSVNLTAEPASVPAIEEDSAGFHFSGDTNGISVGGYLVVFHRGPLAAMILTAAVKGSESLQQTIDLAQKQAQKIRATG